MDQLPRQQKVLEQIIQRLPHARLTSISLLLQSFPKVPLANLLHQLTSKGKKTWRWCGTRFLERFSGPCQQIYSLIILFLLLAFQPQQLTKRRSKQWWALRKKPPCMRPLWAISLIFSIFLLPICVDLDWSFPRMLPRATVRWFQHDTISRFRG